MNFTEYKDSYFSGVQKKALEQLAKESYTNELTSCKTREELQEILDSMDKKTSNEFLDFLDDEIKKNPKKLKEIIKIGMLSSHIGCGLDDVIQEKKNPFVKKFIFSLLIVLVSIAILVILLLLKKEFGIKSSMYNLIVGIVPTILLSLGSLPAASNLINIFRFDKLKKLISNPKYHSLSEAEQVGKDTASLDGEETKSNNENVCTSKSQEKEPFTRGDVITFLRAYYRNRRNGFLAGGIILSLILGGLCFAPGALIFAIPALAISFFGFTFLFIQANTKLRKANSLDFYLVSDECTHKYVKRSSEDYSIKGRYLLFKDNGNYRINYNHVGMGLDGLIEEGVYDSVNIGDFCYVVLLENDKKVQKVLSENKYCLRDGEFELRGNKYYPIKDADADTLINNNIEFQKEELSDRQIKAIENAKMSIRKAKPKNRALIVCSIIGILFTILGAFEEMICFSNLVVQPFWFGIPLVISFIATRKTKIAFDGVRSSYKGYSELHYMQNSVAGKTLIFLVLDVLAYLANFFIII